jgi:hypothetical protein
VARPKLGRKLAVTARETLAPVEEVALTPPPYPGWTPEQQQRRERKGRVFDLALGRLEKYLGKKPSQQDIRVVAGIADKMDPDRLLAKGGGPGGITVNIVFVDEGMG